MGRFPRWLATAPNLRVEYPAGSEEVIVVRFANVHYAALIDSRSPRMGEKATYYAAVCLETGEVEAMPVEGNTNVETSVAFLKHLRERYPGLLIVIC